MKKRLIGGLMFIIIAFFLISSTLTLARQIPAFDPEVYSLPHYKSPEENLYPEKTRTIEIKPPILMGQCNPCHENLDNFTIPNVKGVNHWLHLSRGISCDTCHLQNPHTPRGVLRIPMRVCFNCHGLAHGPTGELAPGECKTCHYEKRQPGTHTLKWILADHKQADTHECIMCHRDLKFCNDCHRKEGERLIEEKEYQFKPFLPPGNQLSIAVKIKIPEKMGDCYPCHRDIEAFTVEGLIFKHEPHFKVGIRCAACHDFYPHQPDKTYRIPMQTCYSCHQVTHGKQGVIASGDCNLCHPGWFYKKPPKDHTKEFISGKHKEPAYKDPSYCSMCHSDTFCQSCHAKKKPLPKDHEDRKQFLREHGKDKKKLAYCSDCHTQKFCDDCHQLKPIPHPSQFLADHGKQKYVDKRVCNICHTDRTYCENCHHYQVAKALLIRDNCVKCHPEYKEKKFLNIKNRGHQIHAAHFEMTNTPPFECEKCHALGYVLGHDYATFQLCKECHGKILLGKLIAKWNVDNGELCRRCHFPGSGIREHVKMTPP